VTGRERKEVYLLPGSLVMEGFIRRFVGMLRVHWRHSTLNRSLNTRERLKSILSHGYLCLDSWSEKGSTVSRLIIPKLCGSVSFTRDLNVLQPLLAMLEGYTGYQSRCTYAPTL
jgi:hypothetical protein